MIYGVVGTPIAQHPKPLRAWDNVGVGTPSPCGFSYGNPGYLNTPHSGLTDCKVLDVTIPKHWSCYSFYGILIFYSSVYVEKQWFKSSPKSLVCSLWSAEPGKPMKNF